MNERNSTLKAGILLLIIIIGVGAFFRLHSLSKMAYHHDEAIHAHYSWKLYKYGPGAPELSKSSPPYYNAVFHGPFLYHAGAVVFMLFGDTDFTGRLPYAVFGIGLLLLAYGLKVATDRQTAFYLTVFCAISPVLTYFSRFARNDVLIGTDNLAMLVFALWYFKTRRPVFYFLTVLMTVVSYCTKENSYVGGAVLCSFLVFYCIWRLIFAAPEKRKEFAARIFSTFHVFTFTVLLYGIFSVSMVSYVFLKARKGRFAGPGNLAWLYWLCALVVTILVLGVLLYLRRRFKEYDRHIPEPLKPGFFNIASLLFGLYSLSMVVFMYLKERRGLFRQGTGGIWLYFICAGLLIIAFIVLLIFVWGRRKKNVGWALPITVVGGAHPTHLTEEENENQQPGWFMSLFGDYWMLLVAAAIVFGVYSVLFTVCFTSLKGMKDGVYLYLEYWMRMHHKPRIPGPSTYYIPKLIAYQPLGVLFFVLGVVYFMYRCVMWLVARRKSDLRETFPLPGWLLAFLIYWSVFSIWIYSVLQEKVPWLLFHQALPLILLSGVLLGELCRRLGPGIPRRCLLAIVILLAAYEFRSNTVLNFHQPDDPREMAVYTQSHHDCLEIMREIEGYAHRLRGMGEPVQIRVQAKDGCPDWPFSWYLRNYESHTGVVNNKKYPIVLANAEYNSRIKAVLGKEYVGRQYKLRAWWTPDWARLFSAKDRVKAIWRYLLYRKLWDPDRLGSTNMVFYVRTDLLPGVEVEPEEEVQVPTISPTARNLKILPLQLESVWDAE